MNPGHVAAVALLLGVFVPGIWMAAHGPPPQRLVGLEFTSVGAIMTLTALAVAGQPEIGLIVPLTLAVVTFPGTLVFTRLLAPTP